MTVYVHSVRWLPARDVLQTSALGSYLRHYCGHGQLCYDIYIVAYKAVIQVAGGGMVRVCVHGVQWLPTRCPADVCQWQQIETLLRCRFDTFIIASKRYWLQYIYFVV